MRCLFPFSRRGTRQSSADAAALALTDEARAPDVWRLCVDIEWIAAQAESAAPRGDADDELDALCLRLARAL